MKFNRNALIDFLRYRYHQLLWPLRSDLTKETENRESVSSEIYLNQNYNTATSKPVCKGKWCNIIMLSPAAQTPAQVFLL